MSEQGREEQGREEQRRSDYRAKTRHLLWYRDASPGSREGGQDAGGGEDHWAQTVTLDLSGGGASFPLADERAHLWAPGQILEVQVIIAPKPAFAIARIVRTFEDERNGRCAAVVFASIAPRDRDNIVRTVLNEGLEKPW